MSRKRRRQREPKEQVPQVAYALPSATMVGAGSEARPQRPRQPPTSPQAAQEPPSGSATAGSGPSHVPGPQPGGRGPGSTQGRPRPTAPRDYAPAVLTDHAPALERLAELPLEAHSDLLASIHEDLARTLREAEG